MATLSNSTSVRLPNDVMDILKIQAKEEHRSVSNYIRMILTEFLKHKRQEPNATTRAAIDEARSDMDLEELDVDHFKDFVASL